MPRLLSSCSRSIELTRVSRFGSPVTGSVLARSRARSASLRSSARAEMLSHSYESSRAPTSDQLGEGARRRLTARPGGEQHARRRCRRRRRAARRPSWRGRAPRARSLSSSSAASEPLTGTPARERDHARRAGRRRRARRSPGTCPRPSRSGRARGSRPGMRSPSRSKTCVAASAKLPNRRAARRDRASRSCVDMLPRLSSAKWGCSPRGGRRTARGLSPRPQAPRGPPAGRRRRPLWLRRGGG